MTRETGEQVDGIGDAVPDRAIGIAAVVRWRFASGTSS